MSDNSKSYWYFVSLFHVILVSSLFLYVGIKGDSISNFLYQLLFIIGFSVLLYHGYKMVLKLQTNKSYIWVNIMHVFFIAPLLMYIGYYKKDTPKFLYDIMLLFGFASLGYHSVEIYKMINK